jgi:hypothetical protein
MKLFAFNIDTGRCGNSSATVEAHFVNLDSAGARVLYLFYLIGSWFAKPFVGNLIIKDDIPDTFLARLVFILFTRNGDYDNGNGND